MHRAICATGPHGGKQPKSRTQIRKSDVVRFGMSVTIDDEHGKAQTWAIVGEDEVDASHGKISHVSPMAKMMFGKSVGDTFELNGHEWEITAINAAP